MKTAVGAMNITLRINASRALMFRTSPDDRRTKASDSSATQLPRPGIARNGFEAYSTGFCEAILPSRRDEGEPWPESPHELQHGNRIVHVGHEGVGGNPA